MFVDALVNERAGPQRNFYSVLFILALDIVSYVIVIYLSYEETLFTSLLSFNSLFFPAEMLLKTYVRGIKNPISYIFINISTSLRAQRRLNKLRL